jgi:hypothetical protein
MDLNESKQFFYEQINAFVYLLFFRVYMQFLLKFKIFCLYTYQCFIEVIY